MGRLPVGTVTFLLTDLERSTALWEQHPQSMLAALARHDELLAEAIEAYDGHVITSTGDGLHAVFETASAAVAAAVAAQRALEQEPWTSPGPLRARMGVHTGVPDRRGDEYCGRVLNEAARLMTAGHGGQILVSRTTQELVRDALPDRCELIDLGEYRLRGVSRPMGIAQVVHWDLPRAFPPLRLPDAPGHNLPAQLTTFVGRETELQSLEKLVAEARLLTLTGSGGCGKTRLALELARRVFESRGRDACFVDLAPVFDARAVPSAIGGALGLRDDGRKPLEQIIDYLRDRHTLLVVDNCEHVVSAAADAVGAIVTACARVTVVATSREPLRVVGEAPWRVPSLSTPRAGDRHPEEALEYEAVELFVERARTANPSFTLTHENAVEITEVCERLDGIPLAIELAAARARMMSPRQIREGLADRFQLLTDGGRTVAPRQQTLRASVDWSVDLLDEEERRLLACLSVFAAGFTLESVKGVTTGVGAHGVGVVDLLGRLVDRSLIQVEEHCAVVRYHLLETIREYAAEQLVIAGEVDSVRDRHAAFFLSLAETAEPHVEGRDQAQWADRLELERANLRAAIYWSASRDDGETAQRLVAALIWFFVIRGHLREAKKLFDIALDTPGASMQTQARALQSRSYLGWHRLERAEAVETATEAAELAREVDDRRTEARALYVSGLLTADAGSDLTDLDASIAIARQTGDLWCLAHALGGAGSILFRRGDIQKCQALLEESVAVCEAMGDTYIANTSRYWLGHSLLVAGEYAEGRQLLETVVIRARESGDTFSLPMALTFLGTDYALRGDEELGFANLDEAAAIARIAGPARERQLAVALWMKANLLLSRRSPAARPVFDELLMLGVDRGADRGAGHYLPAAHAGLAALDVLDGDLESAETRLAAARAALSVLSTPNDESVINMAAAILARAHRDFDAASDFLRDALVRAADGADAPALSWRIAILETLAGVLAESGEVRDGVRLYAATHAGRTQHLLPTPPSTDADLNRGLAEAREQLGTAETERVWAEGLAMTIDDAVVFARSQGVGGG